MEYRIAKSYEDQGYKIIKVYEQNGKLYADCKRACDRCGGAGFRRCRYPSPALAPPSSRQATPRRADGAISTHPLHTARRVRGLTP